MKNSNRGQNSPPSPSLNPCFFLPVPINLIGLLSSMQMSCLQGHPSPAQYISTAGYFHAVDSMPTGRGPLVGIFSSIPQGMQKIEIPSHLGLDINS